MPFKTSMDKAKLTGEQEKARQAALQLLGKPIKWWKPKVGANKIRIMPPWTDQGPNALQFWRVVFVHWGVMAIEDPDENNKFTIACPRKTPGSAELLGIEGIEDSNLPCPVCDHVDELANSGDPVNIEMAKEIRRKMRVYSNVIDLNDPVWTKEDLEDLKANNCPEDKLPNLGDAKIQIFTYGTTIFNELLGFYQDNVDIASYDEGHNITIERVGSKLNTKYHVRPEMAKTKAPIAEEQLDRDIYNLDQLMPFMTEEQMHAVLNGATSEEIKALRPAPEDRKQLTSTSGGATPKTPLTEEPVAQTEASEPEAEEQEAAPAQEEEPVQETAATEEKADWPPLDADGDIDFEQLTDEDISNKENDKVRVKQGTDEEHSPYVPCFGVATERVDDCKEACGLYDRCGVRIKHLEELKAKEEAKKKAKKGAGKKGAGKKTAGKKTAGKKTTGKKNNSTPKASMSIEEEMRAALEQ